MSTSIFDLSAPVSESTKPSSDNVSNMKESLQGYSLINRQDHKSKIKQGIYIAYKRVPDASGNSKFIKGGLVQRIQGDQIYIKTETGFEFNVNIKSLDVVWIKQDDKHELIERVSDLENDVLKLTKLLENAIKRISDLETHNKKK